MRKFLIGLLIAIPVLLLIARFIPRVQQREITVSNNLPNIVAALWEPQNWTRWAPDVSEVWRMDSGACRFGQSGDSVSIVIPGSTFVVRRASALNYEVEEQSSGRHSVFVVGVAPWSPNGSAVLAYAKNSNLLFSLFPFLDGAGFPDRTILALGSYLNDPIRYYGYPIREKAAQDTFFVTYRKMLPAKGLFDGLKGMFDSLGRYCRENGLAARNHNVAFTRTSADSVEVLAGMNVDRDVAIDSRSGFMQLPGAQLLVTASYEGPFRDRQRVYAAVRKYLFDHAKVTQGFCFEKYLSPLPANDSSRVHIELEYPLRMM